MAAEHRFRSRGMSRHLLVPTLGACLIGFSSWAAPDVALLERMIWTTIAAGWLIVGVRSRRSGVIVGDDGVVIRGFLRSRRLAWADIHRFAWRRSSSLIPWKVLVIERVDGRTITVPEVASLFRGRNRPSVVERAVEELNVARQNASPPR
jgi:hypothetical protein